MYKKQIILVLLFVIAGTVFSFGVCRWAYMKDNKYTVPAHPSNLGILYLQESGYEQNPFLYLVDGWEYYDGQLLSPDTIAGELPDDYLYIGQYGGFDFGDPQKSPYGRGTYRLNIITSEERQEYALELPEIFSDWKLYINGELRAGRSSIEDLSAVSEHWMVTFFAEGTIEIIVAVSDEQGLYSGFTYPPAFGTPDTVGKVLTHRLIIHSALIMVSLLIGGLCVLAGLALRFSKPYYLLALLCVCFCFCVSYPIVQATSLLWNGWPVLERFGYYGLFFCVILLQWKMCRMSIRYTLPMLIFGILILVSILVQPFIVFETAYQKYLYANVLDVYKWVSSAWILMTAMITAVRRRAHSLLMLGGICAFACALIYDRLFPLFEPILFGWPVENAGFILILIITVIFCCDTAGIYRASLQLEADLTLAKLREETLTQANRLKSDFLGNVSHELQTPMSVITGYAQIIQRKACNGAVPEGEELCENMRCIIREGERASRMVSQLLDVTRLESDCFALDLEPIDLEELIQSICNTHLPILNDGNNRIRLELEPNMPPLFCDGTRLEQVFLNLLHNACRHTKYGDIGIFAGINGNWVQIRISDTGEGIAAEMLPWLFKRYLSVGKHQSGKAQGTGLGLYICHEIIVSHGGDISVESELGEGTTFFIRLPVDAVEKEET